MQLRTPFISALGRQKQIELSEFQDSRVHSETLSQQEEKKGESLLWAINEKQSQHLSSVISDSMTIRLVSNVSDK